MATTKNTTRKIDVKSLARALDGPPKKVLVYKFKHPKYERPGKNPYA